MVEIMSYSDHVIRLGFAFILTGFLLLFAGSFLGFLSSQTSQNASSESESEFAVGGFIGFIPFGFATDRKLLPIVMGLSLFFFLLWLWLLFR
ncbi:hypothetical protein D6764_01035 [Candidatus Woesearchaeota archaeon]|nr:MAG: hypothetical protein D6764_01035 [Candidatus Woesearchaeota archaeon]